MDTEVRDPKNKKERQPKGFIAAEKSQKFLISKVILCHIITVQPGVLLKFLFLALY